MDAPLRVVLDTDAFNEVDDQFTLALAALSSGRIKLEACYAAPFHNHRSEGPGDGMEKSFGEIGRVLDLLGTDLGGHVYRGSIEWLTHAGRPLRSAATDDLIARAFASPEPLYVVGIAAATNLANALLLEPRLRERVRIIWLGGHAYTWPRTDEFNLRQDPAAARVLFDCGAPLIHVPCRDVAGQLRVTAEELAAALPPDDPLSVFLQERFNRYLREKGFASKPLWDVAALAPLLHPEAVTLERVPSPHFSDDWQWLPPDQQRHVIEVMTSLQPAPILVGLFRTLASSASRRRAGLPVSRPCHP